MRRRRFLALGAVALLGCATGRRTPAGESARPLPAFEPHVRVGLTLGAAELRFGIEGARYLIHEVLSDAPIAVAAPGESWGAAAFGGEARVVDPRGWLSQPHARPLRFDPLDAAGKVLVGDFFYAGALEILVRPEGLTLVNELALEEYLRGVVAREMPAGPAAAEALRAQAIAARTYALKRLGSRAELGFDVFGDVQDQVYGGIGEATAPADEALAVTRGQVLLAGDHLIDAYYHSTCGGSTAAVEQAFPLPPAAYLVSVDDGNGRGGFHCERSRYFRWQATYKGEEIERLLARNLGRFAALPPAGVGTLVDLAVVGATPEGRALALRFETSKGSFQVARNDMRWLFADDSLPGLRSTLFLLRKERERGAVRSVTLTGGGWGHGVGMCQVGAMGRAAAGEDHAAILAHYYRGTGIERIYA